MRVVCLVSGGKDSVFAFWLALHQFKVVEILTVRSNCSESLLYHIPNSQYVIAIAKMFGIKHKDIWISSCDINDEINSLEKALVKSGADAVITGGIRSDFQRYTFNRAALQAKMKCFSPLWRLSPKKLMSELLDTKFNVIISSVSGMGLGKDLLGKQITYEVLDSFRKASPDSDISITGEGGEYESFVLDAPFFPSEIKIIESKIHWDEYREEGFVEIIKIKLCSK
ncbi:MAG: diphthine--ammonia ligase [Candidatus Hodarchaeota archaeon]